MKPKKYPYQILRKELLNEAIPKLLYLMKRNDLESMSMHPHSHNNDNHWGYDIQDFVIYRNNTIDFRRYNQINGALENVDNIDVKEFVKNHDNPDAILQISNAIINSIEILIKKEEQMHDCVKKMKQLKVGIEGRTLILEKTE